MGLIHSSDSPESYHKPIALCDLKDILKLTKEYDFQDGDLIHNIKKSKLTGYCFVDLAKSIQMKENIQQTEDELIAALSLKLGTNQESIRNFIRKVIEPKIEHDSRMIDRFQDIPESTNSEISPPSMETPLRFSLKTKTTIDLEKMFPNPDLTTEEVTQVQTCLEKLKSNFGEEEEGECFELFAQNMVCKDRYIAKVFMNTLQENYETRMDLKQPVYMPVKLVISQLGVNQALVNLASKVAKTEFGVLHTGLIIGEWKLDWFNNSMVRVKIGDSMNASNAIAVVDLEVLNTKEQVKKAFAKITEICCEYNGSKTYDRQECNCQHFVTDILNGLQLKLPENQVFNRYFKELKKGTQKRKFYYTESLQSMIKDKTTSNPDTIQYYDRTKIVFENRKILDQFCFWLDSLGYFKTLDGDMDYKLLKAFDRSFCLSNKDACSVYYDYENETLKDSSFFSKNGERDDNSIRKIKYNVQDLDLSDCFVRVY